MYISIPFLISAISPGSGHRPAPPSATSRQHQAHVPPVQPRVHREQAPAGAPVHAAPHDGAAGAVPAVRQDVLTQGQHAQSPQVSLQDEAREHLATRNTVKLDILAENIFH